MFAFGVTIAPFFEEMFFRGFLLPALCTACDWISEKMKHSLPRPLDASGHPQWSLPAMIIGSVLTSLPFAGLHVDQQGHSLGPFLLLIVVSLILCAVRLRIRSLAASTLVHASYNFFIFSLTLVVTGGFRHFDKM
jgi:membrane protease YdiL (CAAX protease family)